MYTCIYISSSDNGLKMTKNVIKKMELYQFHY